MMSEVVRVGADQASPGGFDAELLLAFFCNTAKNAQNEELLLHLFVCIRLMAVCFSPKLTRS